MDVIYVLIPGMIFFGLIFILVLIWAVRRGQYDDLDGDSHRILHDDDDPLLPHNQRRSYDQRMPDADD